MNPIHIFALCALIGPTAALTDRPVDAGPDVIIGHTRLFLGDSGNQTIAGASFFRTDGWGGKFR